MENTREENANRILRGSNAGTIMNPIIGDNYNRYGALQCACHIA